MMMIGNRAASVSSCNAVGLVPKTDRDVLAIYPLMAVAAVLVVAATGSELVIRRLADGIALTVASQGGAPQDIAYFNELAGNEPAAYLSDSNLDLGQDAWRLKAWWDASGRPGIARD